MKNAWFIVFYFPSTFVSNVLVNLHLRAKFYEKESLVGRKLKPTISLWKLKNNSKATHIYGSAIQIQYEIEMEKVYKK